MIIRILLNQTDFKKMETFVLFHCSLNTDVGGRSLSPDVTLFRFKDHNSSASLSSCSPSLRLISLLKPLSDSVWDTKIFAAG